MDIPNLQAFVTVAETASFSGAATQLHLTQPAVSKRVATLEGTLGTALFDRIGRNVSLTEAGRALLPRARQILETLEDSRRAIANLSGRVEGELRIGTSHHVGLHRLPPTLRAYHGRYPQVRLDVHFMDSEAACRAVEHGILELAVVTLPPQANDVLALSPIWEDTLGVVTSPDHPLARRGHLTTSDLARYPAILPSRGTYTRDIIEEAFAQEGSALQVDMSTNYLETIKMLVSIGLGWSVLPRTMEDEEVVCRQLEGVRLTRRLGVVEHTARTLSNAASAFKVMLLEETLR